MRKSGNLASLPGARTNDVVLKKEWRNASFKLLCQCRRHGEIGIIYIPHALADPLHLCVCRLTSIGPSLNLLGHELFERLRVTFFKVAQRRPVLTDVVRVEGL